MTWSLGRTEAFAAAALCLCAATALGASGNQEWNFQAQLDGKPIGTHRFSLREVEGGDKEGSGNGTAQVLDSTASFDVKLLFITAYRYRHHDEERWQNGCLRSMKSGTDDDGKNFSVDAQSDGEKMTVKTGSGGVTLPGCVMSYAYWNPAILKQTHLLNAETGAYDAVTVTDLGAERVSVRGAPTASTHYRIQGPAAPIDLWYGQDGQWLALESPLQGGRHLRYALQ